MSVQMIIMSIFGMLGGFAVGGCACGPTTRVADVAPRWLRIFSSMIGGLAVIGGFIGLLWCFVSPPPFSPRISEAPDSHKNDPSTSVYFGDGCFWHTQYDTFLVESSTVGPFQGRSHAEITSLVGYSGGRFKSTSGTVCYHGLPGTDYSRLGHAEAVSVQLDAITGSVAQEQLRALAEHYFEHGFNTLDDGRRQRLDPQDMGAEYRNMIGIPGGMDNSELWPIIQETNTYNMPVTRGKGGLDGDTEGEYIVYIYDSNTFPFFRGEAYHQFHRNSVLGRPVPSSYLVDLKQVQEASGRLDSTGCNDVPFAEVPILIVFAFAAVFSVGCTSVYILTPLQRVWKELRAMPADVEAIDVTSRRGMAEPDREYSQEDRSRQATDP